jgi:hypothetical protein
MLISYFHAILIQMPSSVDEFCIHSNFKPDVNKMPPSKYYPLAIICCDLYIADVCIVMAIHMSFPDVLPASHPLVKRSLQMGLFRGSP